jgi:S-(hydroxymethyl)glutathione dehydrogenase/alcohol dehydrogenase
MDLAVLLGCAAPTGMGAVYNVLKAQPGDAIAVFGTGGVGLHAVMAAALVGAMPIVAIDPNPTRRALAPLYGATHAIDPAATDVLAEIKKIVPQGVDIAVESSGVPAAMEMAVNATRQQGGRAVVIGNARHGAILSLNPSVFNQGKSLMGTWGGDSVPDRDYGRYARLLGAGRFPVGNLLSKPYALEQADQALQDLASGTIGRPLINMSLG